MSALRKAGVWLGLIEDEDDRAYGYDDHRGHDEDDIDDVADPSAMVRARVADRLAEARAERDAVRVASERAGRADRLDRSEQMDRTDRAAHRGRGRLAPDDMSVHDTETVRPITRTATGSAPVPTGIAYPTQDNLALAPEAERESVRAPRIAPDPRSAADASTEERRYQITTVHPTTNNEARVVGEHYRDGVPVIMNLTDMTEADAKRLVDFAAGLVFALRGTMERVTNRVFLLSPANVQVTAEDKAKIAEGGFFYRS